MLETIDAGDIHMMGIDAYSEAVNHRDNVIFCSSPGAPICMGVSIIVDSTYSRLLLVCEDEKFDSFYRYTG